VCGWLVVAALAFACDPAPTAGPAPTLVSALSTTKASGLVACSQSYDSVTQVVGPKGGYLAVGPHYLAVDSLALSDTVRITAVAPAGMVRWVRFRPDGLVFRTTRDGWSALLYTTYQDCAVPITETPRVAQVDDALRILGYLKPSTKAKKSPWSQSTPYVVGLLQHFSNYAVGW
jgi:hypothetical protein